MAADEEDVGQVTELLSNPDLAGALESERFRHFLDQIPVAIAVADLRKGERIVYANPWFEKLSGVTADGRMVSETVKRKLTGAAGG